MDRREFNASASPTRVEEIDAVAPCTLPATQRLALARLLLAAGRAVLHAREEGALVSSLCQVLVHPGLYSEAGAILLEDAASGSRRRTFYSGTDGDCARDPERFWAGRPPPAFLNEPRRTSAHFAVLPLTLGGRLTGALALTAADRREVGRDELDELQALAEDASLALARMRESAPQRRLAESERRLRETIEHAGVGITRIDMDGHFVDVNQKFCEMLGYTREELVGRATRDFTVPEDFGAGPVFRAQAQLGRASLLIGEKRYVRKDGTHIWVRRTMSAGRDEQGNVRDGISIVEDITERKNAEEAMRRERALLKTIIDALPDYIHVKDTEGHIKLGNAAWLHARRRRPEEVYDRTVHDIFPPELAKRMHEQDRGVVETGEPIVEQEQPIVVFDESGATVRRWSATTKVPMRDDDGTIIGLVGISRDITQRRRMERERAMEHAVTRVLSESRSIQSTLPRLIQTICQAMGWAYGAYWAWSADTGALTRSDWWCDFVPEFDPEDAQTWTHIAVPATTGLLGSAWLEQRPAWVSDIARIENFRRASSCRKLGFRSGYAFPICAQDQAVGVIEFFGREAREPDEALLEVSGSISNQIGQFIRRKRAEESLQESEQQLRAVFENANVGIAMTALDMRYLRVNDKYCSIVGYEREELMRMRASDVNLECNMEPMLEYRRRMLEADLPGQTVEKQLVRKDGSLVWVSLGSSLVRAGDGAPRYFVATIQDISENKRSAEALKQSEEQFRRLAHHDVLTGLPNRALFYDRLAYALAQARRNRWWLAVLFIDVDRFKHVNDTFGHSAGDELLRQVSTRLTECVRANDTVGRLSGDEFAVVLSRLTAAGDAATVAKKIVEALNRPFTLEGSEIFVTASIGITVFPTDTVDQDTLIRNADVAMYRAKDKGRNNYQFYRPEMNRRTREMLSMESELRRAIERDELVLHYQPKVSLATGAITGLEALLRWMHPERGLVAPGEFMPLLEETGLVVAAGDWVLRAVCRQLDQWRQAGMRALPVAVNLSARQFQSPDLAESIRSALEDSRVPPELLEVEITESAIMNDTEEASRTLAYLQSLGVAAAVDDFGTGYSSLAYLKRFPLRALKIDRSFVRDINSDPDDAHITQAVISMSHSLGLKVIAEGVESKEQLAFLLQYGCDEVQGFLFSQAIPPEDCAQALAGEARIVSLVDSLRARARPI